MSASRLATLALATAAFCAPSLAFAQTLGRGDPVEASILRIVLGLLLCCTLAVAAAMALKRVIRPGAPSQRGLKAWLHAPPRRVSVIETQKLSLHADVCVLAFDGVEYLVVISATGASVLREQPLPAQPEGAS